MTAESEEQFTYKYFTNGLIPVRALYDAQARLSGAETPNPETGELALNMHWMSKVREDRSGDIEEITKEEFDQMVTAFLAQKNETKPPPEIGAVG